MATAASGISGRSEPLPFRGELERAFGFSFEDVRVHADEAAARASHWLSAEAYTLGNDIALARPSPSRELLGHELAHVVQQRSGVGPASGIGQAGDRFEQEADTAAAALGRGARVGLAGAYPAASRAPVVQRRALQREASRAPSMPVAAAEVIEAVIDVIDSGLSTDPSDSAGSRALDPAARRLVDTWKAVVARRRAVRRQALEAASTLPYVSVRDALSATKPYIQALGTFDEALLDAFDARIRSLYETPQGTAAQIEQAQVDKRKENEANSAFKRDYQGTAKALDDLPSPLQPVETPGPTLTGSDGTTSAAAALPPDETRRALRAGIDERRRERPNEVSDEFKAKLEKEADQSARKYQGASGLIRLGPKALQENLKIEGGTEGLILAFDNKQFRPISKTNEKAHLNELGPRFLLRYKTATSSTYAEEVIAFETDARYVRADETERAPLPHDIEAIATLTDASRIEAGYEGLSPDDAVEAIVTQSSGYRFRVRFVRKGAAIVASHQNPDHELAALGLVGSVDVPQLANANLTKSFGVTPKATLRPRLDEEVATEPLLGTEYEANAIAGGRIDAVGSDGAPQRLYVYADLFGPRGTEDGTRQQRLFDALVEFYQLDGQPRSGVDTKRAEAKRKVETLADEPLVSKLYVRQLVRGPGNPTYVPGAASSHDIRTPTVIRPVLETVARQLEVLRASGNGGGNELLRATLQRLVDAQRPLSDLSAVVEPKPAAQGIDRYEGGVFASSTIDTDGVEAPGLTGPPMSKISRVGRVTISADEAKFEPQPPGDVRVEGRGLKLEAIAGARDGDRLRVEAYSDDEKAGTFGGSVDGGRKASRQGP